MGDTLPEYRNIRIEDRGPLTWLVLARPDKANAYPTNCSKSFPMRCSGWSTRGGR